MSNHVTACNTYPHSITHCLIFSSTQLFACLEQTETIEDTSFFIAECFDYVMAVIDDKKKVLKLCLIMFTCFKYRKTCYKWQVLCHSITH